ncbi:MAG: hypothetical protein Q9162_007203 [Coniocarpon cinnabarinum]
MPSFFRALRGKDNNSKAKAKNAPQSQAPQKPQKQAWDDAWTRRKIAPEEVRELVNVCSQELKSRGALVHAPHLEQPFLLLPFRPNADPSAAKNFVRNYFKHGEGPSPQLTGAELHKEARLVEPLVLCSVIKWCWARLPGGVVGWDVYELFRSGEIGSNMAKQAFDTLVPLSIDSDARKSIIFDFFDLLAAVAANGKTNGLGGRKLSRLAGWWAFDHADTGMGFDGGYKAWARAADASSHLFFAYLRARAPDEIPGSSGISQLPRSLLALLSQTEYPPHTPSLLQRTTSKAVMIVERVSPTPYSLLQRANTFDYQELGRDTDPVLVRFGDCEDALEALSFESRRVLDAISSTNASASIQMEHSRLASASDSSWSRFQDMGFSSLLDAPQENGAAMHEKTSPHRLRTTPASGRTDFNRPTTPSWADFLSSGFSDDPTRRGPNNMLTLPPDQVLPPLTPPRVQSSQSHVRHGLKRDDLDQPELNATSRVDIDETFWWVWMSSLAGEEPAERKSAFGRCAFVETEPKVTGGGWLVLEEQVKGAAAPLKDDVKIVEKKSRFTFGRKSRQRRGSTGKKPPVPKLDAKMAASTPALARKQPTPDQESRVHQAAAELAHQQQYDDDDGPPNAERRGRREFDAESRTQSVLTLGTPMATNMHRDAGPAMQWANKYDKEQIRAKYLGDPNMGIGSPRAPSIASTMDLISATKFDGSKQRDLNLLHQQEEPPTVSGAQFKEEFDESLMEKPPPPLPKDGGVDTKESRHKPQISEATTLSPNDLNQIARKPVGSMDEDPRRQDHPAFRQSPDRKPEDGSNGHASPAAAAASAAMKNSNAKQAPQPQQAEALQKSKVGSTRKFKNLFSRKKPDEDEVPEALRMQRQINSKKHGQKTLRKPPPSSKQDHRRATPVKEEPKVEERPVSSATQPDYSGEPGPEVETASFDHDDRNQYRDSYPDSDNANRSTAHFSNFTQGPLEDQPAFAGDDDKDDLADGESTPEARPTSAGFRTRAAERLVQDQEPHEKAGHEEFATPMELNADDEDEHGLVDEEPEADEGHHAPPPPPSAPPPVPADMSQDRWAQIRKNAAERRSEEHTHASRTSQSNATERTDDGETSGEESIESRVARIRARVAQLTGNQEAGSSRP